MFQDLVNSSDFDSHELFNKSEVKSYLKNFLHTLQPSWHYFFCLYLILEKFP